MNWALANSFVVFRSELTERERKMCPSSEYRKRLFIGILADVGLNLTIPAKIHSSLKFHLPIKVVNLMVLFRIFDGYENIFLGRFSALLQEWEAWRCWSDAENALCVHCLR